jgi:hypothetical protein
MANHVAFVFFALCTLTAADYFVDGVKGDDSNIGTDILHPFRTISRARDAIRMLQPIKVPIVVNIRAGVYDFSNSPLDFQGPQDSGCAQARITYRAYNEEQVLLSGGREVRLFSDISLVSHRQDSHGRR